MVRTSLRAIKQKPALKIRLEETYSHPNSSLSRKQPYEQKTTLHSSWILFNIETTSRISFPAPTIKLIYKD